MVECYRHWQTSRDASLSVSEPQMIYLDGSSLTLELVEQVAHRNEPVALDERAVASMRRSRAVVERLADGDAPVYGVNTGVGLLADVRVPHDDLEQLQRNVVRSHACGVGDPLNRAEVRAMMLIRANVLAEAFRASARWSPSGCAICSTAASRRWFPRAAAWAPAAIWPRLAHMALVLIGEGEADYRDSVTAGAEALRRAGLQPVVLASKEGHLAGERNAGHARHRVPGIAGSGTIWRRPPI